MKKRVLLLGNSLHAMKCFKADHVDAMLGRGYDVHISAPRGGGEIEGFFEEMGAQVHCVDFPRAGMNPFTELAYYNKLRQLMRYVKPWHVVSMTHKPVVWGSMAAKREGVPRVSSMILGLGYAYCGEKSFKRLVARGVLSELLRRSLRHNEKLFFFNKDDYEQLKKVRAVTEGQDVVFVNGTGVNTEFFKPVERELEEPVFLMMARVLSDKGVYEYVEAARMTKERYPEARFQLLGPLDCNPSAISKTEVESWVEEGVLEYLGEAKDVRPYLREASVFVLPSYREGLSKSILEAMSMGKAILTTDVPGCREPVVEGGNGYLVEVRNATALARGMERFLKYPLTIEQFGRRSREIVLEKYDSPKVVSHVLEELGIS